MSRAVAGAPLVGRKPTGTRLVHRCPSCNHPLEQHPVGEHSLACCFGWCGCTVTQAEVRQTDPVSAPVWAAFDHSSGRWAP